MTIKRAPSETAALRLPDLVGTTLATRLFNQILFLCEREQKVPDQTEVGHIRTWIHGAATV